MPGAQSRGLIQASITKGWDPRVIPARDGPPAQSISPFDVAPEALPTRYVGRLPGGPRPGWPDGHDAPTVAADTAVTFRHPSPNPGLASLRTVDGSPSAGQ